MTTLEYIPTIPSIGIHPSTSFYEYRKWDAVNWHTIEPYRDSPKHGRHANIYPRNASGSMERGDAFHASILEPERFATEYAVMPEFEGHPNSRAYKDAKADWMAAHDTMSVIDSSDKAELEGMSVAVRSHPIASLLFKNKGWAEFAMAWDDAKTGVRCKGRVDLVTTLPMGAIDLAAPNPDAKVMVMVDFKSTSTVGVDAFNRQRAKYAYQGQIAYYLDGLASVKPAPYVPLIVVVQNVAPYDVFVCDCRPLIDEGRKLYRSLLSTYVSCKMSKTWPGSADVVVPLNPYSWEIDRNAIEEEEK